jgi:uncharacterized protein YjbJ (UPF0337 family)
MSKDEIEARGKRIRGEVKEEIGKITDNKSEQAEGRVEQIEGKAQEEVAKVKKDAEK